MQKNNKLIVSSLLVCAISFPFNLLADESNQEVTTPQVQMTDEVEEIQNNTPLQEEAKNEETPEAIEVISTEEIGEFYGLSEGIPTLEETEKNAKEKKEKEKKEKDEKEKADKDAKDPYQGENLKKEKPRHYNTIYKGTKLQWENEAISPKRKKLKESAEKMLGWDYSQEMRMTSGYADCSSFVHLALMNAGFMPKANHAFTTYTMPDYKDYLEEISWDDIKVGDIILGDGHVAFYWGEDREGHPITLESCGRFGVGYGYMMYGGWDFNYTSVWRVKNIDEGQKKKVKKVVPFQQGLVSIWDLVVDEKSLESHDKPVTESEEEK